MKESQIRITKKVKSKLKELGNKGETYSQIIDRVIEEFIDVNQENKIFKVKSKIIKIPKKGNLFFEIPGADASEMELFKDAINSRIFDDDEDICPRCERSKTIILVNREIKIPIKSHIQREVKGALLNVIDTVVKKRGNKLFNIARWSRCKRK